MKKSYILLALVVVLAIPFQTSQAQTKPVKIGEAMPNFNLADAQGKSYSLSNYQGNIVVLNDLIPRGYDQGSRQR